MILVSPIFLNIVIFSGAAVIAARKLSSAMSAAKAASDHMKSIFCGTPQGNFRKIEVIVDPALAVFFKFTFMSL